MYTGPSLRMFFESEKATLLQQIDSEFEKVCFTLILKVYTVYDVAATTRFRNFNDTQVCKSETSKKTTIHNLKLPVKI